MLRIPGTVTCQKKYLMPAKSPLDVHKKGIKTKFI